MALALGNLNLPGNTQYLQRTGRTLLLWLLTFFAQTIDEGLVLLALARHPLYFWTYDFIKLVLPPIVYSQCFDRYLHIRPVTYFLFDHKVDYRNS